MSKGDWVGYFIQYCVVAWFLWLAHDEPLEDQVFYYVLVLMVVVRAEAKRIRIEAKADG